MTEPELPLSNTPERLRNRMSDTAELRLGKILKTEGSSTVFSVHELHAKSQPNVFSPNWAPRLQDDALVTKTDAEIHAENLAAQQREHDRLMEIGEQKSRRFLKTFFIAGGSFLALCVIIMAIVVIRKNAAPPAGDTATTNASAPGE